MKKIVIKGAKEHNLKNVTVEIPKDKFVVITGLSGSGKSSLANEDFPDPDKPVITTNLSFGISTVTFFKLCSLAPLITIFFIIILVALS